MVIIKYILPSKSYLLSSFILVLSEKLMIQKLLNINSIRWVFLQAFVQKISAFFRNEHI